MTRRSPARERDQLVTALTTFVAASQPSKPRSLQCWVTHSTMLARPDSVSPARVWRQSASAGVSGRSPHAFMMLVQALATGDVSGDGSGVMVTLAAWLPLAAWY